MTLRLTAAWARGGRRGSSFRASRSALQCCIRDGELRQDHFPESEKGREHFCGCRQRRLGNAVVLLAVELRMRSRKNGGFSTVAGSEDCASPPGRSSTGGRKNGRAAAPPAPMAGKCARRRRESAPIAVERTVGPAAVTRAGRTLGCTKSLQALALARPRTRPPSSPSSSAGRSVCRWPQGGRTGSPVALDGFGFGSGGKANAAVIAFADQWHGNRGGGRQSDKMVTSR